jgi:hypothetical protein
MEYVNFKKLNILVHIPSLNKNGVVVSEQKDFYNTKYFIVKIGKDFLPFKPSEMTFISSAFKFRSIDLKK